MLALLALLLVTGMTENRERAYRARCLANLRQLATGAAAYAAEDSLNQAVPLHASMVRVTVNTTGWSDEWSWRTAATFAFGGQTATAPFPQGRTATPTNFTSVMMDPDGAWGAATRPLNRYIVGAMDNTHLEGLDAFRCPADAGYPADLPTTPFQWQNRDISWSAAGMPCVDILGNSYKFHGAGMVWASLGSPVIIGRFSTGAAGHRLETLPDPSRFLLFSDPLVALMRLGLDPMTNGFRFPGWHGREFSDNMAYIDGSARLTGADVFGGWDHPTLQEMEYYDPSSNPEYFLRRGRSWRADCYPTPGARIAMRNAAGAIVTPDPGIVFAPYLSRWPFQNYQDVAP
jgi:hypothetical protein